MRISPFICVGLLCAISACSDAPVETEIPPVSVRSPLLSECLTHEEVVSSLFALAGLTSQSGSDVVKATLIKESQKSPACRGALIESIVQTMDLTASCFEQNGSRFNLWREGAELLGDLKASEALDFLIAHLDFSSDFFSTTMSQQPALKAVKRIGDSAIPKLSEVLRDHPNESMRMYAVYCLSGIGGPSALQALKDALPLQTDRCVKGFVQASIEALDNDQHKVVDTSKWSSAFLCNSSSRS